MLANHLPRHTGKDRRLPGVTLLILPPEPVPASRRIGVAVLGRVEHRKPLGLGKPAHPRAGGKVVRILCAAVQHDQQRCWLRTARGR
jgi:hypothetical protein